LPKHTKQEILNDQRVVANSLANIKKERKLKNESLFSGDPFEKSETKIDEKNKKITRGWFDFKALNLKYSNPKIFQNYLPQENQHKNLFKLLNYCRCLSLGFSEFKGCRLNFKNYFHQLNLVLDFEIKKEEEILFTSLLNFFDCKKFNFKLLKKNYPKLFKNDLETLYKNLASQESYSFNCLEIIKRICPNQNDDEFEVSKNKENIEENSTKLNKKKERKKKQSSSELFDERKIEKKEGKIESENNHSLLNQTKEKKYNSYTKEFDLFADASDLSTKNELNELRKKFDKECFESTNLINKLVRKLDKLLNSLNRNSWQFDQEEGYFDTSKFASFIANPNHNNIFKYEREKKEKNTIVSLLLDNSGSMRGKPIITAAITTEIITKVLERCNVNVEILGFTTREWKGGRSKKKWEKNGKPSFPGRLNDLLHIIYKDADCQWYRCKNNLGLILKEGLLKENIDGEALLWAHNRLTLRHENKKILIVISDGAPVDDSTLSSNSADILDNHLKETVSQIQKRGFINLLAIGIGHDVSKYYNNAFVIDDINSLGDVIIENLSSMLVAK